MLPPLAFLAPSGMTLFLGKLNLKEIVPTPPPPQINIPRGDFSLRPDAVYLMVTSGFDEAALLFDDDVDLAGLEESARLAGIVLVDHNRVATRQVNDDRKCDARPTTSCNVCETVTPRLRVTVALLHALPTASTRRKACRLLASLLANTLCRQSAHNAIYRHGRVFCGSHPN
eukprot:1193123-Prorocentrum_minimum.AAC.2